jgi:uncharacterized YccA/Bax inhibitor family protein
MTLQGTINKTFVLLGLLILSASWIWGKVMQPVSSMFGAMEGAAFPAALVGGAMMVGIFGGMLVGFVTVFKKEWAPVTSPAYAVLEGLFLGGVSAFFEKQYPGIVIQAVALTFGTLFCLLAAYKSGLIRATENFKLGIVAATGAIALIYLVSWIMSFFGASIPLIHSSGTFGIAFSLFVVTIAALNLVLDFDFIERGSEMGAPKYMEWYAAFGLLVTLVWLYIEILRLLAKLRDRR